MGFGYSHKYVSHFYFPQLFRHGPRTPVSTYPNDPYIKSIKSGWRRLKISDIGQVYYVCLNSI